jgi:hypothetical protein
MNNIFLLDISLIQMFLSTSVEFMEVLLIEQKGYI